MECIISETGVTRARVTVILGGMDAALTIISLSSSFPLSGVEARLPSALKSATPLAGR